MPLAIIMGKLILNNPYKNQSNVPNVKRAYIESDMLEVSFVWIVFTACGKNENVVQPAAINPSNVMKFIL